MYPQPQEHIGPSSLVVIRRALGRECSSPLCEADNRVTIVVRVSSLSAPTGASRDPSAGALSLKVEGGGIRTARTASPLPLMF